jgi:hypothetical protein
LAIDEICGKRVNYGAYKKVDNFYFVADSVKHLFKKIVGQNLKKEQVN